MKDSAFRVGLLKEASQAFLGGEVELGKLLLRDYVNATIGFDELAETVEKNPKSLMRMLSPTGNPRANNLFDLIAVLQRAEGVKLTVNHQTK